MQQGTGHEIDKSTQEIMLKSKAKSLAELAASADTGLGQLAEAARLRADLGDYLRNRLDPELAAGFMHCNIRDDNQLVVIATSPEWASRLRFEAQQFKSLCHERGIEIDSVTVRVSAPG